MIESFGIGIDISSIDRFVNKSYEKNESFYKRIFTEQEIDYCLKFPNYSEKFAGKFALKEALMKSINKKVIFPEIDTSYLDSKPIVKILNSEQSDVSIVQSKYRFLASLSHENGMAVAVVISEKIM
tara:strand:+ start:92 stop:469 length:378 start_codon:yes stop_codon:yes gene_type:complete